MADIGASESADVGVREHMDNLIVFALLVTILVTALQNVGRLLGRRLNSAGLTAFFGG